MPLEISSSAIGIDHLNKALKGMGDEHGQKWKRAALLRAGKDSITIVKYAARNKSPFLSGLTKKSIDITKGKVTKIPTASKAFTSSGKLKKGKPVRYPFMNDVGVPAQTYPRVSSKGKLHTVTRKASRKPMLFQHRTLGQNADRVVSIWIKKMDYYLGLYAKSTYQTLRSAERAFKQTGGKGRKWR